MAPACSGTLCVVELKLGVPGAGTHAVSSLGTACVLLAPTTWWASLLLFSVCLLSGCERIIIIIIIIIVRVDFLQSWLCLIPFGSDAVGMETKFAPVPVGAEPKGRTWQPV